MQAAEKILEEAMSLPAEERAMVADRLLSSLNGAEANADREWAALAARRLEEVRAGRTRPVSFDAVVARVRARFGR